MEQQTLGILGIVCGTLLLIAILAIVGWVKIEQQRTLQKLLEKNELDQDELLQIISPDRHYNRDFRRGALLTGLGLTLGIVFFLIGGIAWVFSIIPTIAGVIYLLFWRLNAPKP